MKFFILLLFLTLNLGVFGNEASSEPTMTTTEGLIEIMRDSTNSSTSGSEVNSRRFNAAASFATSLPTTSSTILIQSTLAAIKDNANVTTSTTSGFSIASSDPGTSSLVPKSTEKMSVTPAVILTEGAIPSDPFVTKFNNPSRLRSFHHRMANVSDRISSWFVNSFPDEIHHGKLLDPLLELIDDRTRDVDMEIEGFLANAFQHLDEIANSSSMSPKMNFTASHAFDKFWNFTDRNLLIGSYGRSGHQNVSVIASHPTSQELLEEVDVAIEFIDVLNHEMLQKNDSGDVTEGRLAEFHVDSMLLVFEEWLKTTYKEKCSNGTAVTECVLFLKALEECMNGLHDRRSLDSINGGGDSDVSHHLNATGKSRRPGISETDEGHDEVVVDQGTEVDYEETPNKEIDPSGGVVWKDLSGMSDTHYGRSLNFEIVNETTRDVQGAGDSGNLAPVIMRPSNQTAGGDEERETTSVFPVTSSGVIAVKASPEVFPVYYGYGRNLDSDKYMTTTGVVYQTTTAAYSAPAYGYGRNLDADQYEITTGGVYQATTTTYSAPEMAPGYGYGRNLDADQYEITTGGVYRATTAAYFAPEVAPAYGYGRVFDENAQYKASTSGTYVAEPEENAPVVVPYGREFNSGDNGVVLESGNGSSTNEDSSNSSSVQGRNMNFSPDEHQFFGDVENIAVGFHTGDGHHEEMRNDRGFQDFLASHNMGDESRDNVGRPLEGFGHHGYNDEVLNEDSHIYPEGDFAYEDYDPMMFNEEGVGSLTNDTHGDASLKFQEGVYDSDFVKTLEDRNASFNGTLLSSSRPRGRSGLFGLALAPTEDSATIEISLNPMRQVVLEERSSTVNIANASTMHPFFGRLLEFNATEVIRIEPLTATRPEMEPSTRGEFHRWSPEVSNSTENPGSPPSSDSAYSASTASSADIPEVVTESVVDEISSEVTSDEFSVSGRSSNITHDSSTTQASGVTMSSKITKSLSATSSLALNETGRSSASSNTPMASTKDVVEMGSTVVISTMYFTKAKASDQTSTETTNVTSRPPGDTMAIVRTNDTDKFEFADDGYLTEDAGYRPYDIHPNHHHEHKHKHHEHTEDEYDEIREEIEQQAERPVKISELDNNGFGSLDDLSGDVHSEPLPFRPLQVSTMRVLCREDTDCDKTRFEVCVVNGYFNFCDCPLYYQRHPMTRQCVERVEPYPGFLDREKRDLGVPHFNFDVVETSQCPNDLCSDRGQCFHTETWNATTCSCYDWYFGEKCEVDGLVVILCVLAALCAMSILVLIFASLYCWQRRSHRGWHPVSPY